MADKFPYQPLLDSLGKLSPAIVFNASGKVVWCSEKYLQLVHLESESVLDQSVSGLVHFEDEDILEAFAKYADASTDQFFFANLRTGRGVQKKCRAVLSPIPLEDVGLCMVKFHLDTVGLPQDPEAELLASINQNLREGLYRSTEKGEIVYVNDAFVRMFGYDSSDQILQTTSSDLYVEPSKRKELQDRMDYEGFVNNLEVLLKRKNGSIFWGLLSSSKSTDENGQVLYDGALRDISSLKEIERQLKIEKQKAEQASNAKELFLSTMSHELRTPMNAVIGMTHLLLSEDPKPDQVENLNTLKFSAENLLHIINDILDFSKIEAGKIELESEVYNLEKMLSRTTEALRLRASTKNIQLKLDISEDCPTFVIGDSTRLAQVLNNLISNAVKFTYHGEVVVTVNVAERNGDQVLVNFSVKDTGIGIPQNKLASIFSLFTQASSSTTRKFGGTGLGLTITKSLLELHGASLEVESQPGFGSNFHFQLAMEVAAQPEVDQNQMGQLDGKLEGKVILLTEDNEVNQLLVHKFLTIWGAECDIVSNGSEAVERVKTRQYDLILMDLQMPIMDGYTASREIRKLPNCAKEELPIIAVTASALLEVRKRVLDSGMNDYVSKPFSPDQLFDRISSFLLS